MLQFWDAAAAAVALNRTLILPQFTCYCDELWHWSLDHTPQWVCRYVGATNMTLPFTCPQDTVLKLLNLYDQPSKYGVAVRYRESVFLQNPRTPPAIKVQQIWPNQSFALCLSLTCGFVACLVPKGKAVSQCKSKLFTLRHVQGWQESIVHTTSTCQNLHILHAK